MEKDSLSVDSHFILFSGVTWPYSEMTMASYAGSLKVFLSVQVPKYSLPLALIFPSKLVGAGPGQPKVGEAELVGESELVGEAELVGTTVVEGFAEVEVFVEEILVLDLGGLPGIHWEYHALYSSQWKPLVQVIGPL